MIGLSCEMMVDILIKLIQILKGLKDIPVCQCMYYQTNPVIDFLMEVL